ncbi:oligoribonuclease [Enterobacteriaceae endosymbiont of Plateumaris consimilis]|uniref:oligoribonuclease n=1 Tax=Enterobacteriaceae endosymbiont of Plateumaris consimilis TaxID=2675794 RepID=UPI001449D4CF|nr:oligoribonuclease [Enterobacteriaceae endosymbiont of Plateumaris consimilis]QJC28591.1 oligoribonuclease [Enterobacteriaceae endosymbiont of Plateumaris consimilis]
MIKNNNLIWIDLEMTGLNPNLNRIIEIAIIITDNNLNILIEGPIIAIHQLKQELDKMDSWNMNTHTKTGLINKVNKSIFNEKKAEKHILNFLKLWVYPQKSPMCGNSICQDRRFIYNYMPNLEKYFHYRNIDVSTIKELIKIWKKNTIIKFNKKNTHSAIQDIYQSLEELKFYRKNFFKV